MYKYLCNDCKNRFEFYIKQDVCSKCYGKRIIKIDGGIKPLPKIKQKWGVYNEVYKLRKKT